MSLDPAVTAAMRRFLSLAEIKRIYRAALTAKMERLSEVTITTSSYEGGQASGVITGDPSDLMSACEQILQESELGASEGIPSGPTRITFANRQWGT